MTSLMDSIFKKGECCFKVVAKLDVELNETIHGNCHAARLRYPLPK